MQVKGNSVLVLLAAAMAVILSGCGNREQPPTVTGATAPKVATTTVGTEIDDTVVTTKVKSALLADADIKSFDLKVETRKGTVQLSGFVDNQTQIERALTTTRGVEGVKNVENNITIKDGKATVGNTVDDGIVTTRVKSALLADPGVKSFDIAVVTRKGEVQLSGFVDSQAQIEQAVAIARNTEGVTSVGNEMSIKK
ncbi:MAG: BON domain-containing protein [Betaproteobacteria bacterium]